MEKSWSSGETYWTPSYSVRKRDGSHLHIIPKYKEVLSILEPLSQINIMSPLERLFGDGSGIENPSPLSDDIEENIAFLKKSAPSEDASIHISDSNEEKYMPLAREIATAIKDLFGKRVIIDPYGKRIIIN